MTKGPKFLTVTQGDGVRAEVVRGIIRSVQRVLSVWGNDSVERAANASRTESADMGVDHCCADVLVTKKFLDGTNVVAVIE